MPAPNPAESDTQSIRTIADALRTDRGTVAVAPPADGPGFWAGGPSAVYADGVFWLAYRLRRPVTEGRGYANVVARSGDGVHFEPVATVTAEQFGCASLERPALVPLADGGWRLYLSCSTAGSKHWWVEAIDAPDVAKLPDGDRRVILPGSEREAWKDVVVRREATPHGDRWRMWACRHPLGDDDEADRMQSWYATGTDGLSWTMHGPVLVPTPGTWDARGTRITAVLGDGALYDGRASAAENWQERTGVATSLAPSGPFHPVAGPIGARSIRYVSVAESAGAYHVFWEAARADGAHDLRVLKVPRPVSDSQSE